MVTFKMKYVVEKTKRGHRWRYWQPKAKYLVNGVWVRCPFKTVRLPDDDNWIVKASELNRQLDVWRNGKSVTRCHDTGTVGWLIMEYKKDERFQRLRLTTQKKNLICLNALAEKYGDVPADHITRLVARSFCMSFTAKSRPSLMAAVCRTLFNFGRDIGGVKENPFESLRLARIPARQAVWSMELIEQVKAAALTEGCPSIALAIQLALDTGQRAGDLRTLTWAAYTGTHLRFRQSKTGVLLDAPVMRSLRAVLDATERKAPAILICEATGKPYSKDMLSRAFRDICAKVPGTEALQFRDLRRNAVVRLAEHGCTNAEIAAITGHSLQGTVNILEVYCPRSNKMAENAIAKVEKLEPHYHKSE